MTHSGMGIAKAKGKVKDFEAAYAWVDAVARETRDY
jgi:hypothetical protein